MLSQDQTLHCKNIFNSRIWPEKKPLRERECCLSCPGRLITCIKSKETYSQSFQIDGSFTQSISRLLLVLLLLCYVNLSKNSSYSRSREALFSKASAKVRQKSIRSKHFGKKLSFFNIRLQIMSEKSTIILCTPYYMYKEEVDELAS